MCLLAFAINQHPDYPFILIANRDEFFDRPTLPLHRWQDHQQIIGGRDEEAGGSWLAIHENGRWAALTNFRDPSLPAGEVSRGMLVNNCLLTHQTLPDWFDELANNADKYSGFNLVAGDLISGECFYLSNQSVGVHTFSDGVYAFSNGHIDDQWPKMHWLRNALADQLTDNNIDSDNLFNLLAHPETVAEEHLPSTGISADMEKKLSSPFIKPFELGHRQYGTRSSAIVQLNTQRQWQFFERGTIPSHPYQKKLSGKL